MWEEGNGEKKKDHRCALVEARASDEEDTEIQSAIIRASDPVI